MPLPDPPRLVRPAGAVPSGLISAFAAVYVAAMTLATAFSFASALCSRDFPVRVTDRAIVPRTYVNKQGRTVSYEVYQLAYVSDGDPGLPPKRREVGRAVYAAVRPGERYLLRGLLWDYALLDAEGGTSVWMSLGVSSLIWTLLLGLAGWRARVGLRRRRELVERGVAIPGRVAGRGRRSLTVELVFPGDPVPTQVTRPAGRSVKLSVGDAVTVLVDPSAPRRWVIYELSGFRVAG